MRVSQMDEVDTAQDYIEKNMAMLLAINSINAAFVTTNTTGKCIWCEDHVSDERRWCSGTCRDAWERANGNT